MKKSNSKLICEVLAKFGPLTKAGVVEKMRKKSGPFAKGEYDVSAYLVEIGPFSRATYSGGMSLVSSGHVVAVGKEGRSKVYGLTAKGLALAAE